MNNFLPWAKAGISTKRRKRMAVEKQNQKPRFIFQTLARSEQRLAWRLRNIPTIDWLVLGCWRCRETSKLNINLNGWKSRERPRFSSQEIIQINMSNGTTWAKPSPERCFGFVCSQNAVRTTGNNLIKPALQWTNCFAFARFASLRIL